MAGQKEGQTIGQMGRRKDRLSFIEPFWTCPGVQQEKSQKKSQIKHCFRTLNIARAICWKYAWCKGEMMLHMLEICEVRSSFLKLIIMITHIKMMKIPCLDTWSMLLSTSASYKLFKSLLWHVIVQTLS